MSGQEILEGKVHGCGETGLCCKVELGKAQEGMLGKSGIRPAAKKWESLFWSLKRA